MAKVAGSASISGGGGLIHTTPANASSGSILPSGGEVAWQCPHVHSKGEQDRIGAAVAMTREQVDVVATTAAIPGPPPGG